MKHIAVATAAVLGLVACGGGKEPFVPTACVDLKGKTVESATIDNAVVVPQSSGTDEYCKVNGTIHSTLKFQVNVPTAWDGKQLVYYGGGGWDGALSLYPDSSAANAVSVASNGGHISTASDPSTDASFALNNLQGQQDFGYLSAHTTLLAAKGIVRLRFGKDAQRHYFSGCSNGGREALIQATRWPKDYDGIVSIAPGYAFSDLAQVFTRNSQAFYDAGGVNPAKAATIANAVVAACDALDGVADGIVSKPLACNFDPGTLRCSGADNNSCLTDAQITAARVAYSETRDSANNVVYPGWEPGGEDLGWPAWISNSPSSAVSTQYLFANGFVQYWLTGDPNFDFLNTPNFSVSNYPTQMASLKATVDATPDLRSFFADGRKLVLAHGMHDWALSYKASINYFNNVGTTAGTSTRDANMEFFLLPGMQHCSGGVGADYINLLEATTTWVESKQRSSSRNLIVFKFSQTQPIQALFARPLCLYPTYPKYKGTGATWDPNSFFCSAT